MSKDLVNGKESAIMSDKLIPNAALILPPTGGDRYLATAKVARIPIIIRNLNAANKAGIEHFHILISSDRKREVLQLLQSENKFQGKRERLIGWARWNKRRLIKKRKEHVA